MTRYLDEIGRHPVRSASEQVDLARRAGDGDDAARDELIVSNLRLVVYWARQHQGRGLDLIDLVQEGTLGLMHAVERFDGRRGFRFSTYASYWIRQSLQRAVQRRGSAIRLPERAPRAGTDEVALDRDGSPWPRVVASLDHPLTGEAPTSMGDLLAADETPVEEEVAAKLQEEGLSTALARLPEPERAVVHLRFGLDGDRPATVSATARALGVGERRVKRIEASALHLLADQPELAGVAPAQL